MIQREGNFNYDESDHWQMSTSIWDWEDLVFTCTSLYVYYLLNEVHYSWLRSQYSRQNSWGTSQSGYYERNQLQAWYLLLYLYLIHVTIVW